MPRWKELKRFCDRDGWELYIADGGRPTYTDSEIKRNILGNQIVFNSLGTEYSDGDCKALYPGDEK